MVSDKPYLQSWRPVYELSSAVAWFTGMNTAYALTFFSSLPAIGFLLTSSFCAAMMVTRLAQALPRWQQHRRLKGKKLALLKLTQKQCQTLQSQNQENGVWLGWGFEWQRFHGQRTWDLLRSDTCPPSLKTPWAQAGFMAWKSMKKRYTSPSNRFRCTQW